MSKLKHAGMSNMRYVQQLVGECIELGDDPLAWNRHMLGGLMRLVGAAVALVVELRVDAAGRPALVFGVDRGWTTAKDRAMHYEHYVVAGGFRQALTFQRLMAIPGRLVTRRRQQLVPDTEWERSTELNDIRLPVGLDDLLLTRVELRPTRDVFTITLSRLRGEPPFGPCESHWLHSFMESISAHLGYALTRQAGVFIGLPERLQATLRCLLEGDSEKQAALRMGLSRFTLHDYVGDLFRFFAVSSRPELLSRCHRHCESALASNASRPEFGLPQRLQNTLRCLLDGDSEKQAALRLKLSRYTIHEYVTNLYRRFEVNSRAKLLVKCWRGSVPPGSAALEKSNPRGGSSKAVAYHS